MSRRCNWVALRSLVLGVLLGSMACSGPPKPGTAPSPLGPASLKPGDAIRVRVWQEPDLTGEFTVDPNGNAVFPLLGERNVVGISPDEVESRLVAEYKEYLENPSIDVTVLRRIAILGEVRAPGLYPVDATVSLTDAVALAGGIAPTGDPHGIQLVRNGQVLFDGLDLTSLVGATSIQSGDQIVVRQQSWARRNITFITAGLGAVTSIVVAFIIAGG